MQLSTNDLKLFSLDQLHKPKKQLKTLSCVYLIYSKAAKYAYVGSALLDDKGHCPRLAYHRSRLANGKHPCQSLQSDYALHPESFVFKILETCKTPEARAKEELAMLRIKQQGNYQLYNVNHSYKF